MMASLLTNFRGYRFADALQKKHELKHYDPLLISGLVLGTLGVTAWSFARAPMELLIQQCLLRPWLPLLALAMGCVLVHFLLRLERGGLLSLLPQALVKLLTRPLFELVRVLAVRAVYLSCNMLHVVLLACFNLTEQQRRDLLEGMDPAFRKIVFQGSLLQSLPSFAQRLLLGRQGFAESLSHEVANEASAETGPILLIAQQCGAAQPRQRRQQQRSGASSTVTASSSEGGYASDEHTASDEGNDGQADATAGGPSLSLVPRRASATCTSTATAAQLVEGSVAKMEGFMQATVTVSTVNHLLREQAQASAVCAARVVGGGVAGQVAETYRYSRTCFSRLREGIAGVASTPQAQVALLSACGGAVLLGTGGAATGFVSGGLLGAAFGVVPAVFTFGLSIPIGTALGAGAGLCLGTALGGAAGFVSGGVAGFGVCQFIRGGSALSPDTTTSEAAAQDAPSSSSSSLCDAEEEETSNHYLKGDGTTAGSESVGVSRADCRSLCSARTTDTSAGCPSSAQSDSSSGVEGGVEDASSTAQEEAGDLVPASPVL
mmetsp:Transcript_12286/g.28733  ORF Transcript_12286/g.28733 Transcript_12286/m.28733 type:complete len:548 (+) Transcript_12286:106-1749(+)